MFENNLNWSEKLLAKMFSEKFLIFLVISSLFKKIFHNISKKIFFLTQIWSTRESARTRESQSVVSSSPSVPTGQTS